MTLPLLTMPGQTTPLVPPRSQWLPGYLALAVIWGSSFLFIKVGITQLHPLYVTLGRVTFGAVALSALLLVMRLRLPRDPRVWAHSAVLAAVGVALPFTLFGYGELHISSVLAGIWNATTPLLALPVAVLVFRAERLTVHRVVGLVLGFAGVLVILGVWHGAGESTLTGQLMCLAAASCYSIAIPYQRRFLSGRPESGVAIAGAQMIVATGLLALVAPLVAGAPPSLPSLSLDVVASIFLLGVLGTGIAFAISFRVIRLAGVTTSASVTYLLPIVATLMGVLVLGEDLAWNQPAGAVIVLLGVAISQGRARRPAAAT